MLIIREFYSPECGRWKCTPGENSAEAREVQFMFRGMAARNGRSWKPMLPKPPLGKIDAAVAPTNSQRVFALIQTKDQGSVWRSDDGGENWHTVNYERPLIGRAGYYIRIAVS